MYPSFPLALAHEGGGDFRAAIHGLGLCFSACGPLSPCGRATERGGDRAKNPSKFVPNSIELDRKGGPLVRPLTLGVTGREDVVNG